MLKKEKSTFAFPLDATKYELLHLIGCGTYSRVYEARCLANNKIIAIKKINLEEFPLQLETVQRQIAFWSKCEHPNVVDYYGSFVDGSVLWILNEFMGAGSMRDIIRFSFVKGFRDENLISALLAQVVAGVKFFHDNHEIHRDIRSSNILVNSEGVAKLGDFGLATSLVKGGARQNSTLSLFGEECYMAPEVLRNENGYSEKTDIWSLGLTSIEFGTGKMPYAGMKFMESLVQIIDHDPPSLPESKGYSSAYRDFVKQCLMAVPDKRATASELINHRFLRSSKGAEYVKKNLIQHLVPLHEMFEKLHGITSNVQSPKKEPVKPQMIFDFPDIDDDSSEKSQKVKAKPDPKHRKISRSQSSGGEVLVGRFKVTRTENTSQDDSSSKLVLTKKELELGKNTILLSTEENQQKITQLTSQRDALKIQLQSIEEENDRLRMKMKELKKLLGEE